MLFTGFKLSRRTECKRRTLSAVEYIAHKCKKRIRAFKYKLIQFRRELLLLLDRGVLKR